MQPLARSAFWWFNALAFAAAIGFALSLQFGDGRAIALNPDITASLLVAAVGAAVMAVVCLIVGFRTRWRWLSVLVLPILAAAFMFEALFMPVWDDLADVTLRDGRVVHLGETGTVWSDRSYDLWQEDAHGLLWRRIAVTLSGSRDGSFTGGEDLILSADGRSLLVLRGGYLTDCVSVGRAFAACNDVPPAPLFPNPDYHQLIRAHSAILQGKV